MSFPSSPSGKSTAPWITFYFAVLFFFSGADLFFSFRVHDLNIRSGQVLLLAAALAVLAPAFLDLKKFLGREWAPLDPLKVWAPFLAAYALAAVFAQDPSRTFLKLLWAIFNIGGATLVVLGPSPGKAILRGLFYGIGAVAVTIWVQFLAVYWGGIPAPAVPLVQGQAPCLWFHGFPLGYAQPGGFVDDIFIYRPHAFYYEPSYAGCAMAFAFPLMLALGRQWADPLRSTLLPAMVLVAALMTSSRSALLGIFLETVILLAAGFFGQRKDLWARTGKVLLTTVLLVGILSVSPRTRAYLDFILGPLGPKKVIVHLQDEGSSEGWRLANVLNSLKLWAQHPLLGMGSIPSPSGGQVPHGLGQSSEDMWLEVGVESGLLGFLAFLFALGWNLKDAWQKVRDQDLKFLVGAALAAHFLVSMNFTSTFPRLDYWLLFYLAVRLCRDGQRDSA
jgi:hypothetical protein